MSIKKLNLNLGANDPSKSTFNNFSYFSKWARAIKSGLMTLENEWNRLFLPFFSDMPTDEDINPWTHGLDGKTLYGDADAPISNQDYSNGTRPLTLKNIMDRIYTSLSTHSNDIQALKRRAENAIRYYYTTNVYSTFPVGYINGLNLTYNDVDKIDVSVGTCKSDDGTTDIRLKEGVTLDIDDDLDTGTESSDAWYYIWIFYNPSTEATSLKFSEQYPGSGSDPTAPDGYTKKRYLGSVRNDSGDFLEFTQEGDNSNRCILYKSSQIIINGAVVTDTWTRTQNLSGGVNTNTVIPPTAHYQWFGIRSDDSTGGVNVRPYWPAYETSSYSGTSNAQTQYDNTRMEVSPTQECEMKTSSSTPPNHDGVFVIRGYEESLEVSIIPDAATPTNATVITTNAYPPGYINGLNLTYNDVDQITVSSGYCRSNDNTADIVLDSDTLMDIDSDLDTGTESSSQWYYVWIFYNPSTEATSLKFSVQYPGSGSDPTAPDGYTKKRCLGSVRNYSDGHFLEFIQTGNSNERRYDYESSVITPSPKSRILLLGNNTSWTETSTDAGASGKSAADFISHLAVQQMIWMSKSASSSVLIRPTGVADHVRRLSASPDGEDGYCQIWIGTNRTIDYKVSSAATSGTIDIHGYIESL